MVSTGNRIQAKRVERGLSRSQLAQKLEITRLQVWRIETGKTKVNADFLPAVATALETTVAELVETMPVAVPDTVAEPVA